MQKEFSLPHLYPPPPRGRGEDNGGGPPQLLPLPLGGGGYRWGRDLEFIRI